MQLSGKDIYPTLFTAAAVYTGWLAHKGRDLPWHLSHRWVIVILLVAGLVACATGASASAMKTGSPLTIILSVLGGLSILIAIIGLIKPSGAIVAWLAITILVLWTVTTVRHAVA